MSGHLWPPARDLWPLKTPMRIGEWHETGGLVAINANFWPLFYFRTWQKSFPPISFGRNVAECAFFLQAGNICNSLKNFPRYFSNFSQLMMFISLAVCRVLIHKTMKKDERVKIPGWKKRINMVSLAVLSLANCKFSKNAQNENCPRPSWGGDHGHLLQFPSQIQFSFKFITILKAF